MNKSDSESYKKKADLERHFVATFVFCDLLINNISI